jgi:hypothetical protein
LEITRDKNLPAGILDFYDRVRRKSIFFITTATTAAVSHRYGLVLKF